MTSYDANMANAVLQSRSYFKKEEVSLYTHLSNKSQLFTELSYSKRNAKLLFTKVVATSPVHRWMFQFTILISIAFEQRS